VIGKEQVKRLNIVVSSGTGTGTVTNQWDIARRVRIAPPSESTTYDVTIKDASGYIIFENPDTLTGTLSMLNEMSLGIVSSVTITNASGDGTFVVLFDLHWWNDNRNQLTRNCSGPFGRQWYPAVTIARTNNGAITDVAAWRSAMNGGPVLIYSHSGQGRTAITTRFASIELTMTTVINQAIVGGSIIK
jgi:hypothetical protein